MEGVKAEVQRQIIMNFYRKNIVNGNLYTVKYFEKFDVGKMLVYQAMAKVESGESHLQFSMEQKPGGRLNWHL